MATYLTILENLRVWVETHVEGVHNLLLAVASGGLNSATTG